LLIFAAPAAWPYSVLTHEAIIDSAWDSGIKPLLLRRFPAATREELKQAHAYAYGGCIIQDLGYYPFGSKFFSDLTHYVRSGDFVLNLIRESQDLNEYAFALGALSHYAADNSGHSMAVNLAVPLLYPKLGLKFGKLVTYADDPFTHAKTEFAFDVYQAARGRYASAAYKNFIGFEVAKPVLQRAFEDTYGIRLEKVFLDVDLAIGSYRRAVGTILPAMTRVAWQIKKQEIRKDAPSVTSKTFLYNLSRSSYEKNWGSTYQRPGIRSEIQTWVRLGGGPRLSTTTRGGAMRTITSADALKTIAPAKTNPINRFRTITLLSFSLDNALIWPHVNRAAPLHASVDAGKTCT
jgi:hypothetical protein